MSARIKQAIEEFRRSYSALLTAAEKVREEIERETIGFDRLPAEMAGIVLAVCEAFHVTPAQILSRARHAKIARPRMVVLALAADLTPFTQEAVAGYLNRDHGMIAHARRVVAHAAATEPRFAAQLTALRRQLSKLAPLHVAA